MGLAQEYIAMLVIVLIWILVGFTRPSIAAVAPEKTMNMTAPPKSVKDIEKEIVGLVTMVTKTAMPYFVRNSDLNISGSCMSTLIKIFIDVRKLKVPPVKLLDAMFKPTSGLLDGTFAAMGDYDECLAVSSTKKGEIPLSKEEEFYRGQYCTVVVDFPPEVLRLMRDYADKKVNWTAFGKFGPFVKDFPGINFAMSFFKYNIGVCLPSTCSIDDLRAMLTVVPIDFVPLSVSHCEDGTMKPFTIGQLIFLSMLLLLAILVLCGTIMDAWQHLKSETIENKQGGHFIGFLVAFSVYSNTVKLMTIDKNYSSSEIRVINGMYVLGTFLVVIYHTYFLPFFLLFSSKGSNLGRYFQEFDFTLLVTMGISIEAYFIFSGLLMVYPRFKRGQKNVKINVIKLLVRRYIRLAPSLLFVLGIIIVLPIVGNGPVWGDIFGKAAENAQKWWWKHLLMFNNFLEVKDQTFLYLWFIPCLMQISIVGAILLWILARHPSFGMVAIIATGVACNIALGVLTAVKHYPPTYAIYYYNNREYFEEPIYTSPLSHVSSFGIGMLLGYFMAKYPSIKFSKIHVVLGWIVSIFLTIGIQLIMYAGRDGLEPDPVLAAVYAATHRMGFSLGLAWIILACTNGYGGALGKLLAWRGFGPLSKLGYFGYLIHYVVITFHVSVTRALIVYSHYENIMRIFSYSFLTFLAAYVLYITFELPLTYVESLFLPPRLPTPEESFANNNYQQNGKHGVQFNENFLKPSNVSRTDQKNTYVVPITNEHSKL